MNREDARLLDLKDIEDARRRIGKSVYQTPLVYSAAFSGPSGNSIFLKLESLQATGSFKERGALNKMLTLSPADRRRGVVTASAGNYAQGVAYHAARMGVPAEIWMPVATPRVKVNAVRGYGAEVVLQGDTFDETCAAAKTQSRGAAFLHPFDDLEVIAGQGTVGLELMDQRPALDAVVVPIGGGGLIAGVACAMKELYPGMQIIGAQTANLPAAARALESVAPVTVPAACTIADGIAVRRIGVHTHRLMHRYVDEIVTVEEEEIESAMIALMERERVVAEGAGAVALAAALSPKFRLRNQRTAVIVSGGNVDLEVLGRLIGHSVQSNEC